MSDNSPEYFERLKGYYGSVETISEDRRKELSEAFNTAAALARKNAELRDSVVSGGCAIIETGADVFVQNSRAESAESANRALQAEVDRLNRAGTRKVVDRITTAAWWLLTDMEKGADCGDAVEELTNALESFAATHAGDEQQERDAARYRWLVEHRHSGDGFYSYRLTFVWQKRPPGGIEQFPREKFPYLYESLEEAIDAAIAAQQKEQAQRASFDPLQDEPKENAK